MTKPFLISVIISIIIICTSCGNADDNEKEYRLVKVDNYKGNVELCRNDDEIDLFDGIALISKDEITTGENSNVVLLADTDKHIMANENTKFSINAKGTDEDGSIKIKLQYGEALFEIENKLGNDSTFEVTTPNASLSVRGTKFHVAYDKENNATLVMVEEGVVYADYDDVFESEEITINEIRVINENNIWDSIEDSEWDMDFELLDESEEFLDDIMQAVSVDIPESLDDTGDEESIVQLVNTEYEPLSAEVKEQYEYVVTHIESYIFENELMLDHRHDFSDYYYILSDYDNDMEKELIIRMLYKEGEEYKDDLFLLDFDNDISVIVEDDVVCGVEDINNYYVEYNGQLGMYQWEVISEDSYESNLYILNTDTYQFELKQSWNYAIDNLENIGIKELHEYGCSEEGETNVAPIYSE